MKRKPKPSRLTATHFPRKPSPMATLDDVLQLRMAVRDDMDDQWLKLNRRLAALEAPRPSLWRRLARLWP